MRGEWSNRAKISIGGQTEIKAIDHTITDSTPTIVWDAVDESTRYEVFIQRTDGTPRTILYDRNVEATELTTDILRGGDYKVWVRPMGAENKSGRWSWPRTFSIEESTSALESLPLSPLHATLLAQPQFTWTTPSGAATFDLHLTNGSTVFEESGLTSDRHKAYQLVGTRTMDLEGSSSGGQWCCGEWSVPVIFHSAGKTALLTPTSLVDPATLEFRWQPVQGAVRYELFVSSIDGEVVLRDKR